MRWSRNMRSNPLQTRRSNPSVSIFMYPMEKTPCRSQKLSPVSSSTSVSPPRSTTMLRTDAPSVFMRAFPGASLKATLKQWLRDAAERPARSAARQVSDRDQTRFAQSKCRLLLRSHPCRSALSCGRDHAGPQCSWGHPLGGGTIVDRRRDPPRPRLGGPFTLGSAIALLALGRRRRRLMRRQMLHFVRVRHCSPLRSCGAPAKLKQSGREPTVLSYHAEY